MATEAPANPGTVIDTIRQLAAEFHADCSAWDEQLSDLLQQLEQLDCPAHPPAAGSGPTGDGRTVASQTGIEQLAVRLEQDGAQLRDSQSQIVNDLADVRNLLERQTELFSLLMETRSGTASSDS